MSAITITNAGLNLIRDGLKNANNPAITWVALGTSSTAPAATDTQLGAETFRKAVTIANNGGSPGEILIVMYLAPNEYLANIQEVGFFGGSSASSAANSGVLLAHGLYAHNPHVNTESIQFQLDFTV
jgi:hypothetical protein